MAGVAAVIMIIFIVSTVLAVTASIAQRRRS